jgi:hypothetical protein
MKTPSDVRGAAEDRMLGAIPDEHGQKQDVHIVTVE